MKKSAQRRTSATSGALAHADGAAPRDRLLPMLHSLLLGAAVALIVATPLISSEAAILGSHVVIMMATLVLTALWLGCCLLEVRPRWHVGPAGLVLGVFLVLHSVSGGIMMHQGHARPTLNTLWLWVSFGCTFFTLRQLVRRDVEQRALVSVLLAMAVSLSAFGLYQTQFIYPRTRAAYQANPERVLQVAGEYAPPGSPQRRHFEDRLASTEPTGPFALTNSLAGVLAPSLVLIAGLAAPLWRSLVREKGFKSLGRITIACIGVGVVLACLVLTKSRTAWLATVAGIAWLALSRTLPRAWLRGRFLATVAVGLVGIGVAMSMAGGLDRQVLTEAPKSVLYRLQYWQATSAMIADLPWWGCGPGNFKDYYTRYKLPEASETVADPHNFLLEIGATAGLPAASVFVLLLVVVLRRSHRDEPLPAAANTQHAERTTPGPIYAGAGIGFPLAYFAGWAGGNPPVLDLLWVALPVFLLGFWLLHPWVVRGFLPAVPLRVAAGTLLVNLLGAGGMSFPGVALWLWVPVALLQNVDEVAAPADAGQRASRWLTPVENRVVIGLVAAGALLSVVLGYVTLYRPVLADHTFNAILAGTTAGQYSAQRLAQQSQQAAQRDPWWAEPCEIWAAAAQRQWITQPSANTLAEFDRAMAAARQRNGQSFALARQQGDWLLEMHAVSGRQDLLQRAVDAYTRAVSLYPASSLLHAQLAATCQRAGDTQRAWAEATEALRLDQRMPHEELKLACQSLLVPVVPRPAGHGSSPAVGGENAEQLMQDIRKRRNPE